MRRRLGSLAVLSAAVVVLVGAGPGALPAGAQTGEGQISGRVTDGNGVPLANITTAAVPVGGDEIVTTKTNADGDYILTLDPGTYDVGFNAEVVAEVNTNYNSVIFGGPGPGPTDTCTVCGGAPITVTAGVVTTNISAALPPASFTQTGTLRPLSGKILRAVNGRFAFTVGCHEYPNGCTGTADLRLGTSTSGPVISRAAVSIPGILVAKLRFTLPIAVRHRLEKLGNRGLEANIAIVTPQSTLVTRFKLRERA
jgi:Carboxypeptidase regulatory-like domain